MDDALQLLRAAVSLAAVLGLLVFLSRRLKKGQAAGDGPLAALVPRRFDRLGSFVARATGRTSSPPPRDERITVVARTALTPKAHLVVAEFGGIRYVLGVSDKGVDVVDTQESSASDAVVEPVALVAVADDRDAVAPTRRENRHSDGPPALRSGYRVRSASR
ncbi:flagellar biosynthetic protein FliO [uncultured Microbacterium sp.]|uniref:flagellar biosynthetic protein FliO n=1 Tax=uncultured Microbacterium sp. TaxID=191216 RepID=UPI0025DE0BEF|nr:flagellar biosynthetic protein FliO [uncultured Microbacterium sp.]